MATATEMNKSDCSKALTSLAGMVTKEVKNTGKVTIPGLVMIKARVKLATKAGNREILCMVLMVAAKQAKTLVVAYAVAAINKIINLLRVAFFGLRAFFCIRGLTPYVGPSVFTGFSTRSRASGGPSREIRPGTPTYR